jgi:hypothetical protein
MTPQVPFCTGVTETPGTPCALRRMPRETGNSHRHGKETLSRENRRQKAPLSPDVATLASSWSRIFGGKCVVRPLLPGLSVIPVVALAAMGRPIPLVPILFPVGIGVIALMAVLATPMIRLTVDPDGETLTINWISFCGLVRQSNTIEVADIQKLVYGVTTLCSRSVSGSTNSFQSRHSFYAHTTNGTHVYLSPKSKATAGLSRKLGTAISKHLDLPFVRRNAGMGRFEEEPMT